MDLLLLESSAEQLGYPLAYFDQCVCVPLYQQLNKIKFLIKPQKNKIVSSPFLGLSMPALCYKSYKIPQVSPSPPRLVLAILVQVQSDRRSQLGSTSYWLE